MLAADFWRVFGPILAGAYALFGLALLTWCLRPSSWLGAASRDENKVGSLLDETLLAWLRTHWREAFRPPSKEQAGEPSAESGAREYFLYPLVLCAVFGLGVLLESAVDDFVDDSPAATLPLRAVGSFWLLGETEQRFAAIFQITDTRGDPYKWPGHWWPGYFKSSGFRCQQVTDGKGGKNDLRRMVFDSDIQIRPSSLGREILMEPRLYAHIIEPWLKTPDAEACAGKTYAGEHQWISVLASGSSPFDKDLTECEWKRLCKRAESLARKLYYDASNWAIRDERISSELSRWGAQIALMGSIHVVAAISMLGLALAIPLWILALGIGTVRQEDQQVGWLRRIRARACRVRLRSTLAWFFASLLVFWFSAYGYTIAQRNMIERTLGFYVSAAHYDGELKWPAGSSAIHRICKQSDGGEPLGVDFPWCTEVYLESIATAGQ